MGDDPADLRSGNDPTLGGEGHRAADPRQRDQAQLDDSGAAERLTVAVLTELAKG